MSDGTEHLHGFDQTVFTYQGKTRSVFKGGTGPAVIVIHEIPGITPPVAAFGRRVIQAGFTAVLPSLFGQPGRPASGLDAARAMAHVCISREFATFALGRTSPITVWLRALAAQVHADCGGPGVGVVGMCVSGGFALAMMIYDGVLAPVLSQPSMPWPVGHARRAAVGLSDEDLAVVKQRVSAGREVLGLRFSEDGLCPRERFDTLHRELGAGFHSIEIDSRPGNPDGIPPNAHSVLTVHLVDRPGHPTRQALDRVLAFLRERLA